MPAHAGVTASLFTTAVRSILDQTVRDIELLVMLDGVPAGPLDTQARRAEREDSRVRVFRHATGEGIAASLNDLVAHGHGELIARMDADDVSLPDRLRQQADFLQGHPDVFILGTFAEEINER